jgi:hypothetical protein
MDEFIKYVIYFLVGIIAHLLLNKSFEEVDGYPLVEGAEDVDAEDVDAVAPLVADQTRLP